jgi:hypothetical protein
MATLMVNSKGWNLIGGDDSGLSGQANHRRLSAATLTRHDLLTRYQRHHRWRLWTAGLFVARPRDYVVPGVFNQKTHARHVSTQGNL